ncbi:hypothetical protein [Mangrovibacterium marinum]|uniref:Rieske domain-containing protein n=1 Tax=Mangrovibacterium marinum TaxID=1639118 RepID=A0A2T5BYG6_9BACT|nr:hypothetical protein [Mangrovibacterium marinum]PTN07252.1 hypothetical protein C8N47_12037 [Mangrovibacterium marinum]
MNGFKPYFRRLTLALALITGATTSCSDEMETSIPYVRIDARLSFTTYNGLKVPGITYFKQYGYGGIFIIYNGLDYSVCDAACPYEADASVIVEDEGGIGTCPKCGSQYNLLDGGSLMSGSSRESLRLYGATASGNYLYITN